MRVDILPGAIEDLTRLEETDLDAANVIWVVLDEADADPDVIDKLTDERPVHVGKHRIGIKRWSKAQCSFNNLFRLRVFDTPATSYRVVYGFDWRARRIGILAVVHRDNFDYELSDSLGQRILADWRKATGGLDT